MTRATAHRAAAAAAATITGAALLAAPAMAGTRADISMKTIDQYVSLDSSAGTQVRTLDCGSGYTAFTGSFNQASAGVSTSALGVPGGRPSQFPVLDLGRGHARHERRGRSRQRPGRGSPADDRQDLGQRQAVRDVHRAADVRR